MNLDRRQTRPERIIHHHRRVARIANTQRLTKRLRQPISDEIAPTTIR